MRGLAAVLVMACMAAAACSLHQSGAASSARSATPVTGPSLAPASGALDAEVAMPPGFPSDFPIYPHARLTAAAAFASSTQTAWGMEWETLDSYGAVGAFYTKQLNQGDWTINVDTATTASFKATFSRKSDTSVDGRLAANPDVTLTKILVSLVVLA
jgi:hypothetical protein